MGSSGLQNSSMLLFSPSFHRVFSYKGLTTSTTQSNIFDFVAYLATEGNFYFCSGSKSMKLTKCALVTSPRKSRTTMTFKASLSRFLVALSSNIITACCCTCSVNPVQSVDSFAARTSDLCSRAYPMFSTDDQLSLSVEHFVSGLADNSSRE